MAAGDVKEVLGSAESLTITLDSLANGSGRGSTAVDNSSDLYLDELVEVTVTTASSDVSSTGYVSVYVYCSVDGENYTDGFAGTDGAHTPINMVLVQTITANAVSTTYRAAAFSVAACFGGRLPPQWGIAVVNSTGAALASSGNSAQHVPVYANVAQS